MEMRGKNQSRDCRRLFEVKRTLNHYLEMLEHFEENNCKPEHNRSKLLGH
jgi:hypothetical protein